MGVSRGASGAALAGAVLRLHVLHVLRAMKSATKTDMRTTRENTITMEKWDEQDSKV